MAFVAGLRDSHGEVQAGAFLRDRRIAFHPELRSKPSEFARIFFHEIFHFVWLRLGNTLRRSWEELLAGEFARGARGELGWSSEWRKKKLDARDVRSRTRRWREYACESFCDTAAWLYASVSRHDEWTLSARCRAGRKRWFTRSVVTKAISI